MKVTLIDYTGKGMNDPWYAAAIMIWTKQTRTEMNPSGLETILSLARRAEAEGAGLYGCYCSLISEFCDFTFLLEGVTRAFTHQLVRTRTLSFAQQAMQVLRMDGWQYHTGTTIQNNEEADELYENGMRGIAYTYSKLVDMPGVHTEDARGILPTNILTNIVVKGNLRAFADMLRKRASPRNQGAKPGAEGEWTVAHREMKRLMIEALPWTKLFLLRDADVVANELYMLLEKVEDKALRVDLTKPVDQLMTNIGSEL